MKKVILLTSFGTSEKNDIERCLYPIRDDIKKEFQSYEVFTVFTSKIIRERLLLKYDMQIFSLEGSLKRLEEKGYEEIIILPLYLIENEEHKALQKLVLERKDSFRFLSLLEPLLSLDNKGNLKNVESLITAISKVSKNKESMLFVGHGIKNKINIPFIRLKEELYRRNIKNIYFSTFEGRPNFDETVQKIFEDRIDYIRLTSFLIFSGYHSKKDIFGEMETSYCSKLKALGVKVEEDMLSLGEREEFRKIFIELLRKYVNN
ncbi:sirohydrochlorin cobaltochelatase [Clostridium cibarium]|uniref:Sirohydrochlorin cobaltochelatase n=1 Tax=Clostridium cibarium TaxID=2762247 RepID=A0ABR8PU30_9CLOT|nr:sirohydrochlorin cobaltochelatase [Clostridium cibarium]MBD7911647.1 sirohydrochlorin cobaltochelatase [Clostridium cibarium]